MASLQLSNIGHILGIINILIMLTILIARFSQRSRPAVERNMDEGMMTWIGRVHHSGYPFQYISVDTPTLVNPVISFTNTSIG